MSAPVVAVTINARGGVMPATPRPWDGDLPALAVPDSIWTDPAFADALLARADSDTWEYACQYEKDEWRKAMLEDLAAIHAELRARAGGAA